MKKLLFLACLLTPSIAPSLAMAQATPPAAAPPGQFGAQGHGQGDGPHFEEAKARMTQRLQEALACVQAAQNAEALRACRPQHPGGEHGGPGGQEEGSGPPQGAPNAWSHPQGQQSQ